jgi:hypothetical protein
MFKKKFHDAHQQLLNQGLNPKDVAREQKPELMIPKLALVGVFQTLETFCEAGKTSVMSSAGPLNTRNLMLFLGALRKSVDLGEQLLLDYQNTQTALKTMEEATELVEQQIEEHNEETNKQENQEDRQPTTENQEGEPDQSEFLKDFDIRKLN